MCLLHTKKKTQRETFLKSNGLRQPGVHVQRHESDGRGDECLQRQPEPGPGRQSLQGTLEPNATERDRNEQRNHQRDELFLQIVTGKQPQQRSGREMLNEKNVRFQAALDVDPGEFRPASTDPKHQSTWQNHFGRGPAKSGGYKFAVAFAGNLRQDERQPEQVHEIYTTTEEFLQRI